MSMRIGIDGYNLAMPHGTGVATYGVALASALHSMGHTVEGVFGLNVGRNREMREVMFYDVMGREAKDKPRLRKFKWAKDVVRPFFGLRSVDVPITDSVEKETFAGRLPVFDRLFSSPDLFDHAHRHFSRFKRFTTLHVDNPPDIMHWTYPVPVRMAGTKNVYTLHDLVPLRLPFTTLDHKQFYNCIIRECLSSADHICTVSESSRADILERYDVSPDKVTNTYQASPMLEGAVSADPAVDAAMITGIFGLNHRGYFLFFGAIEPKKNVGRIIEAYLSITSETPLVIVGARAWQSEGELRLITGGGYGRMAERIVRLDYLPRELLLKLVRGAKAVVFPSLYEGFGLPVLEAMQLGTPVLTSNTSSLPEVAGDAAIRVNPYSVQAISDALRTVDGDEDVRNDLGRKGPLQAAFFSEERYRERLALAYAKVR